jgi:hypothetical protein
MSSVQKSLTNFFDDFLVSAKENDKIDEAICNDLRLYVREYVSSLQKKSAIKRSPVKEENQCMASTKAGPRCKKSKQKGSDYCSIHKDYSQTKDEIKAIEPIAKKERCGYPTLKGTPCKKYKKDGCDVCNVHEVSISKKKNEKPFETIEEESDKYSDEDSDEDSEVSIKMDD